MLGAMSACSNDIDDGKGGAGGATTSSSPTTSGNAPTTSGGGDGCPKPTSFPMTVTLADGTKIPGGDPGVPASTTVVGALHLLSDHSYSVTPAGGGAAVIVEHDAKVLSSLDLSEGASVSLFVGYAIDAQFAVAYRLQVELSSASGELLYFGAGGELDIAVPASRVAIDFGAITCTNAMGSGTGVAPSLAVHEVDVTIDGADFGPFKMGVPASSSLGGKPFEVDNRDAMENFYGGGKPLAVLGRSVPQP